MEVAHQSFREQLQRELGPEPSLVPLFVEALETGKSGGSTPEDVFRSTLETRLPELADAIRKGWKEQTRSSIDTRRMSAASPRIERFYAARSWEDRVRASAVAYEEYQESVRRYRRSIIKAEVAIALQEGIANWVPSSRIRDNKSLVVEATVAVWDEVMSDCCRRGNADHTTPPVQPTYGLRLSRIECHEKDEIGHDEIYVVSIAVDGGGILKAETSPVYSMNEGSKSVKWPNRWIYPPADPKGFLDLAVELWEDDGGYSDAAKAIAALAASVAAAGGVTSNPIVIGAGVALGLVAGLISIAGWLDDDDRYGRDALSWTSAADLESGSGPYTLSFVNRDTGWRDFTSYNYDLTIDLVVA